MDIKNLFNLIKENPDLPIMPIVNSNVVPNRFYSWRVGTFGEAEMGEYYVGRSRIHIKGNCIETDVVYDMVGYTEKEIYKLTDKEWNDLYQSIPWKKCIAIKIIPR